MKVLQITSVDETVKHLLLPLIDRLQDNGFTVETVCSRGRYSDPLRRQGYVIHNVSVPRSVSLWAILKNIRALYRLMRTNQYDIIHVHAPVSAFTGRIAAKLYGKAVIIYTVHGFYFHENMPRLKYHLFYTIEKILAYCCTHIMFFQSEEDYKLAKEKKFLRGQNLFYIGNGVDVHVRFNPASVSAVEVNRLRSELGLEPEYIVVTFIGRLVYEKGVMDLLRAFTAIDMNNAILLVVGSALATDRDRIPEEELEPYRNHPRIIFTGFREDIPQILALTDIFCMPSYREGKPRSVLEAMAMNCAIIAGNIRGCREEVIPGRNGFLFDIKNVADLSDKLISLLSNIPQLKIFKKNSHTIARAVYDEETVLNKQMEIYERLHSKGIKNIKFNIPSTRIHT